MTVLRFSNRRTTVIIHPSTDQQGRVGLQQQEFRQHWASVDRHDAIRSRMDNGFDVTGNTALTDKVSDTADRRGLDPCTWQPPPLAVVQRVARSVENR